MPKVTFIEHDLVKALLNEYNKKTKYLSKVPKWLKGLKAEFSVTLEMDKDTFALIDDDPLLLAQLTEAGSEEYKKTLAVLGEQIYEIDKAVGNADQLSVDTLIDNFESDLKSEPKKLEKCATKAIQKAFKKYQSKNKNAKTYKFKIAVKLVVNVTQLGAGIVELMGTPFTGGFSGVIGLWTTCKELIKLYKNVNEARRGVEKQLKVVYSNLSSVKKTLESKHKEVQGCSKDIALMFTEFLAGPLLKDVIPTCKQLRDSLKVLGSKRDIQEMSLHKVAKAVPRVLKQRDKAVQDCIKARSFNPKVADPVKDAIDKLEKDAKFPKLLDRISNGMKRLDEIDEDIQNLMDLTTELKKQEDYKKFKQCFEVLMKVADLGVSSAGDALDPEDEVMEKAIKIFNGAVAMADEELANRLK